jgi:hypothetical protein
VQSPPVIVCPNSAVVVSFSGWLGWNYKVNNILEVERLYKGSAFYFLLIDIPIMKTVTKERRNYNFKYFCRRYCFDVLEKWNYRAIP